MTHSSQPQWQPQWKIDEETIRDCPGDRTEIEWKKAVADLERTLHGDGKACSKCGQHLAVSHKYMVTETASWMPGDAKLPRGRWAVSAYAATLVNARMLQRLMGQRATVWIMTKCEERSTSYRRLDDK
jgi:hypothetical protein